ncbi:MAG: hypothetical protein BWY71_02236 [Planctomycetes bacterium ADurb.Bin412]|nr:MAG: hypothetical protein BWY71_02236 [Planctomycetes bacterium ADurb.Bin412]
MTLHIAGQANLAEHAFPFQRFGVEPGIDDGRRRLRCHRLGQIDIRLGIDPRILIVQPHDPDALVFIQQADAKIADESFLRNLPVVFGEMGVGEHVLHDNRFPAQRPLVQDALPGGYRSFGFVFFTQIVGRFENQLSGIFVQQPQPRRFGVNRFRHGLDHNFQYLLEFQRTGQQSAGFVDAA